VTLPVSSGVKADVDPFESLTRLSSRPRGRRFCCPTVLSSFVFAVCTETNLPALMQKTLTPAQTKVSSLALTIMFAGGYRSLSGASIK